MSYRKLMAVQEQVMRCRWMSDVLMDVGSWGCMLLDACHITVLWIRDHGNTVQVENAPGTVPKPHSLRRSDGCTNAKNG